MLRRTVFEYFDSIVSEIDLFTEIKIQEDVRNSEECWNKRREQQIEAVRQIEKTCLRHVDVIKTADKELILPTAVFVEYCFTVEYGGMLFVVKSNRFVDTDEIELFKVMLVWDSWSSQMKMNYLTNGEAVFQVKSQWLQEDVGFDLSQLFTSFVVDISSWLDRSWHINKMSFSKPPNRTGTSSIQSFAHNLKIRELVIDIWLDTHQKESAREFVTVLVDCNQTINKISLKIFNFNADSLTFVQSIPKDERISLFLNYSGNVDNELSQFNQLNCLRGINTNYISVGNWHSIEELCLNQFSIKLLESADLSGLVFLRSLHIVGMHDCHTSIDWRFLDPIRESLELLRLDTNDLCQLSWRIFHRMTRLKKLEISEPLVSRIELNSQGQMFSDLIQLQSLNMILSEDLLVESWCCHLPSLQDLTLRFQLWMCSSSCFSINFVLPALESLSLFLYSTSDLFIQGFSKLLSYLCHARVLNLTFNNATNLTRGWFEQFKHLEKLIINMSKVNQFYSQFFDFFHTKNLAELELFIKHGQSIDRCILQTLTNLRRVTFNYQTDSQFDTDDMSMFENLPQLQQIRYRCGVRNGYIEHSNKAVFLNQFNHVLVTKLGNKLF